MSRKRILLVIGIVVVAIVVGLPYASYATRSVEDPPPMLEVDYTLTYTTTTKVVNANAVVVDELPQDQSFWSYFSDYWTFDSASTIRVDDPKFAVSTWVLYTSEDGVKEWVFQQLEEFADYGTIERDWSFEQDKTGGTYQWSVTLLVKNSLDKWAVTIAWDGEAIYL